MSDYHEPVWVQRLLGKPGLVLAFVWGLAEGTLFFVVPDVLITLTAMFRPRRALLQAGAATAGAVLAGALMYGWASASPDSARAAVDAVPFVEGNVLIVASLDFSYDGPKAVLYGPLRGIPYKVYAVTAPGYLGLTEFLLLTIPARLWRFLLTGLAFALLGQLLKTGWLPFLGELRPYESPREIAIVHAVLWALFYALYWGLFLRIILSL
ncbi:MAG TPA: hypothetical protein VNN18_11790 [Candidatus Xenobia bacterium]|nr:hypothetical protein [Candidatus Xenobia bacterium]